MGWVVFWFVMALVVAVAAASKDRNPVAWFFYGLLLWPVALVHVLVMGPDEQRRTVRLVARGEAVKCPFCAETIKPEAKVCRHCGRDLPAAAAAPYAGDKRPCPHCGHGVPILNHRCPHCDHIVPASAAS